MRYSKSRMRTLEHLRDSQVEKAKMEGKMEVMKKLKSISVACSMELTW